jgi:hypothetical protein
VIERNGGGEEKEKIGNQQTNFKDFDYWLISLDPLKPNCTSQIRE